MALCHGDTLELAFAADIGLKGGKDGQHAIEGAPCCARGVDALLDDFEVRTGLLDLVGDIGEVPHRAAQPVQAGDDKRVSLAQDGEDPLQLGAAVALRTARLLLEDWVRTGTLKRLPLQGEVLIRG